MMCQKHGNLSHFKFLRNLFDKKLPKNLELLDILPIFVARKIISTLVDASKRVF